ncbi:C4-dicarboxylate transporter DctA [Sphingomonas crusticola]|uniref:C4-dicarboxylate transporter DctA n=1 Tax=Sphingomonas crusticola TaxID=1697973 RepID=UPI000E27CE47|nr:C4-dicarboxylate transporter DctA [Sphingomonas crusticola]
MATLRQLWVQVLIGAAIGAVIGLVVPSFGTALQPIADGFIKLVKMLLAPIIFGTIVIGLARMGDLKEVGRVGAKALLYFEILSTFALLIGLAAVNIFRPGSAISAHIAPGSEEAVARYAGAAHEQGIVPFLLNIIPDTLLGAFTGGTMLQVILIAVMIGVAASHLGAKVNGVVDLIDQMLQILFRLIGAIMVLAPLGAAAGMAYTVGKFGIGSLLSLGQLVLVLYGSAVLFVVVMLGMVMRIVGLPLIGLLRYFRDEILIVFGTCSTEAVLPRVMQKLEALGIEKPVVGLVLPAGYTFNADGTSLYLAIAAIFVAQATGVHLSLGDQLVVLGVLLLTSKGSAGVAGAGFITLAATLSAMPSIPVTGLALLLGVDRFLNVARAVTNLIGNCVATVAVARWDGAIDLAQARRQLTARERVE